jgi:Fic family protein
VTWTRSNTPPFTINPDIVRRVAAISEMIGRWSVSINRESALRLRRINRIRTIHGTLAIEGNALSESQVTAILDGKRVLATPRELLEVRNAIAAYEGLSRWSPDREDHALEAHRVLMSGLISDAGFYRSGAVGVLAGEQLVHVAPPAERVPVLMAELFAWLAASPDHPLIASAVFHYEFEVIHPFSDGNGRMGRLWQSLILTRWNPLCANIPVESLIFENQSRYYEAIQESTAQSDAAPFVTFVLSMVQAALAEAAPQVTPQVTPQVAHMVRIMLGEMSREALQEALKLSDRKSFRERYLKPAIDCGLIEMTIPERPNSRLQRYRLTDLGRHVKDENLTNL